MKKIFVLILLTSIMVGIHSQDLPKDVQKVYDKAEKLQKKAEYAEAIKAYKEVLRSVSHVQSMINIGDIQMNMRAQPNYREAYEYYEMAISTLSQGISATDKKPAIKYMTTLKDETIPKRNKAKSYVDDFDKAKELKQDGNRLLEDSDLKN